MITTEQLQAMPDATIIRCGRNRHRFTLHRQPQNRHDCWFYGPQTGSSRRLRRAYDGSKRLPPDVSCLTDCFLDNDKEHTNA